MEYFFIFFYYLNIAVFITHFCIHAALEVVGTLIVCVHEGI